MRFMLGMMLLCAVLGSSGCASFVGRKGMDSAVPPPADPGYFAGVRTEAHFIGGTASRFSQEWAMMPLFLLDLPLSFVADVLCIPSDFMKKMDIRKADEESQTDPIQATPTGAPLGQNDSVRQEETGLGSGGR